MLLSYRNTLIRLTQLCGCVGRHRILLLPNPTGRMRSSFALDNRSRPAESSGSSSLLLTPVVVVDGVVAVVGVAGVDDDVGEDVEVK